MWGTLGTPKSGNTGPVPLLAEPYFRDFGLQGPGAPGPVLPGQTGQGHSPLSVPLTAVWVGTALTGLGGT